MHSKLIHRRSLCRLDEATLINKQNTTIQKHLFSKNYFNNKIKSCSAFISAYITERRSVVFIYVLINTRKISLYAKLNFIERTF